MLFAWLRIAIRHRYQPAMPALERFLTSQGRRKFLRPLYEDLMATDWGKAEAKRIYAIGAAHLSRRFHGDPRSHRWTLSDDGSRAWDGHFVPTSANEAASHPGQRRPGDR